LQGVPLISARKGTDPALEAHTLHSLYLIARQPPTSITSLPAFGSLVGQWFPQLDQ